MQRKDPFIVEVEKIKHDALAKSRHAYVKDIVVCCQLCLERPVGRQSCKISHAKTHVNTVTHQSRLKEYFAKTNNHL